MQCSAVIQCSDAVKWCSAVQWSDAVLCSEVMQCSAVHQGEPVAIVCHPWGRQSKLVNRRRHWCSGVLWCNVPLVFQKVLKQKLVIVAYFCNKIKRKTNYAKSMFSKEMFFFLGTPSCQFQILCKSFDLPEFSQVAKKHSILVSLMSFQHYVITTLEVVGSGSPRLPQGYHLPSVFPFEREKYSTKA